MGKKKRRREYLPLFPTQVEKEKKMQDSRPRGGLKPNDDLKNDEKRKNTTPTHFSSG